MKLNVLVHGKIQLFITFHFRWRHIIWYKSDKPFWQFYNFERNGVPRVEMELESFPTARFVNASYYYQFVYPRFIPSCYKKTHTWIISSIPMSLSPWIAYRFFFKWLSPSVYLSVCLFVTLFLLCSHHRIIMEISGVITNDRSDVHAKGQGQRSKVKVTEVTTQINCFRTVTPIWSHKWWWNEV